MGVFHCLCDPHNGEPASTRRGCRQSRQFMGFGLPPRWGSESSLRGRCGAVARTSARRASCALTIRTWAGRQGCAWEQTRLGYAAGSIERKAGSVRLVEKRKKSCPASPVLGTPLAASRGNLTMQFISNGPDIPEALLQAHEDGRVVFFCGAGISYPAGLPGFKGLVDGIYQRLETVGEPIEADAFKREQFDVTLNLLEQRFPGQRGAVRKVLAQALQPKLELEGATDTHTALLQLARSREGELRLVTTNFYPIFEPAAKRSKQPHSVHAAPMLPIPKDSHWNGLVYLHGLLPAKSDDSAALHRLVLTSGDFGRAYLTERWAARFVSELFRNYVVCFVGYSINDQMLRYMMDALAADRMLGEETPQAYALGDYKSDDQKDKTIEWEAKGVIPILYKTPKIPEGGGDHSALHQTLKAWAATYRDGVLGKERIVLAAALAGPSASTQQDDFSGRMLWALSDESGLPAKRFAELDPVPPLEWLLTAFSEERFRHGDLSRFGIPARAPIDPKLRVSLH